MENEFAYTSLSLKTAGIIGASIGLVIISLFVIGVNPKPEWGQYWLLKPLLLTPLTTAMGTVLALALYRFARKNGITTWIAGFLSLIVLFISLWFGIILGLNGTLWN